MSRDRLVSIGLDFPKENKEKVMGLIREMFGNPQKEFSIKHIELKDNTDTQLTIQVWNWDLEEGDFKEFKKYCTYIGKSEYEALDEGCFIWEKEDDN